MSRKALSELELENALEDIFGLPDDPEKSDDDQEPDEEQVPFSTARLQKILEDVDSSDHVSTMHLDGNQPSPQSSEMFIDDHHAGSADEHPGSVCQQSDNSPVLVRSESRQISRTRHHAAPSPSSSDTRISRPTVPQPVTNDSSSSDDTDDSDADEETWKKIAWTTDRPNPEVFDEVLMTTKQLFNSKTRPLCFFEKYFTNEAFELMCLQTNLYADQQKIEDWTPVDHRELKAFLGILIIMGYKVLPSIDLYWSSDPGFRENDIADIMTVKRFKKIMRCLHLNDNAQQPERNSPDYDKLFKLRPLLNIINEACKHNANDSTSQSIDESMVLFKGRSSLKQYMPMKPIKRGYKVWCRCDSETGYLYEFDVYTGKTANTVEEGLGSKVVKHLMNSVIENKIKNVHVTFDNFFTDYKLLEYLYENGIYASGTVRRHRVGLPQLIKGPNAKKLKLSKGEFKWRVRGNVAFVIWQDNKEVLVLSTAFHPKAKTTTMRTQKDGTKLPIPCPRVIKQYNNRMGGVDKFDQLRSTYTVGRRSKRWWLRLFYFLLDASITNAFLLSKKSNVN